MLLRIAFTVAPILFGLDKFAEVLTNDWTRYLSTEFNDILPGSAADAMHIVGVVEIAAGVVVAVSPRFGGLLVAGWLAGIILNLLSWGATAISRCATSGSCSGRSHFSLLASAHAPQSKFAQSRKTLVGGRRRA